MPQYTFERLEPDYAALWAKMQVVKTSEASFQAKKVIASKDRYKAVEKTTGVPWFVVGCMHMRESNGDFNTWLHNGDPMKRNGVPARTVHVPKNRPPDPNCTWEEGAYDALITVEKFNTIDHWDAERVAYVLESFNGFGYRNPSRDIPSPYLWGGTSVQERGKFVRDGVYDKTVMDPQIGGMAVLKMLMSLDSEAQFVAQAPKSTAAPTPPEAPPLTQTEGKAIDTEENVKPLTKSKTILGDIGGYITTVVGLITGFFDKLNNPYTLAAFIFIVILVSVFAVLVIKGRLDVNKLVKHLADEE